MAISIFSYYNSFSRSYPIVFVSRNHQQNGNIFYPQSGLLPGMGPHSRFAVTGGKLIIRDSDGSLTVLIDSTKLFGGIRIIDVQQPCVHWDGNRILFSGIEHRDSSWRIYEIKKDGSGFKKITKTNRSANLSQFGLAASKFIKYDDIDPVYLPDGNIVFASTRYPTISIWGSVLATNLFITDSIGSKIYRITSERNGAEKPYIDPLSGRIVYSRYWVNIDMPSSVTPDGLTRNNTQALSTDIGNFWQVNIINPDGDMGRLYSADSRNRLSYFAYRPRIMQDGRLLALYIPGRSMTFTGGSPGIRYFESGYSEYHYASGADTITPLYVQNPPSYGTVMPPYTTDPVPLPDGKIMFSLANSVEQQDYGIYTSNLDGSGLSCLIDLPLTLELNAEVLLPKQRPPIVDYLFDYDTNSVPPTSDLSTIYQGGLFRFDCMNIYSNSPVDAPVDDAPRLTQKAKIRFFANYQRQDTSGQDFPVFLGERYVDYDGKIAVADAPANLSLFEQVTDSTGKPLVSKKGKVAHVTGFNFSSRGSGTKCVGCHAGHTLIPVPANITESQFTNFSTSAIVTQSSFRNSDSSYCGNKVIDRRARNTDLKVNWISAGADSQWVELKWELPLDIREIKIYNIYPNQNNGTNIQVNDCELFLYKNNSLVHHILSTGPLSVEGKSVYINPWVEADKIKLIVKNFSGNITGEHVAGIAEIETISRVHEYSVGINKMSEYISGFDLFQNYPNPFNNYTIIDYYLPFNSDVRITIFDISGKTVDIPEYAHREPGKYSVRFNAKNLSSGIYFYRIDIVNNYKNRGIKNSIVKKMILIK